MGVNGTNLTQAQWDTQLAGLKAGMAQQKQTGTFNTVDGTPNGTPMTQDQNLAAVLKQPGNAQAVNPSQYLQGVLDRAGATNQSAGTTSGGATTGTSTGGTNNGGAATSSGNSGIDIPTIYGGYKDALLQQIKYARDQALAGLAGQDDQARQLGASQLNDNDVSGARLANQLRESMANAGLLQGGDYISQQVGQNASQQQNANNINQNMSNTLNSLLAQKNAINDNANANDTTTLEQIQSQMMQAQLDQSNADRQYGVQAAPYTGSLGGKPTLQALAQQYNQDPNNPVNQGQVLSNQGAVLANQGTTLTNKLDELKLADYPAQSQGAATLLKQSIDSGQISNDQAKFTLDQLKDPNSLVNKLSQAQISQYTAMAANYAAESKRSSGGTGLTPTATATQKENSYTSGVFAQLAQLDPSDIPAYLNQNAADIVANIGQKGFDNLKTSATADQTAQGKANAVSDKTDQTAHDKAVKAAQNDYRWSSDTTKNNAIINEYEAYYN